LTRVRMAVEKVREVGIIISG